MDFIKNAKRLFSSASISSSGSSEYSNYVAILNQKGTNAPTATVLKNDIGTITFSYISPGYYSIVGTGLFTVGKTFVMIGRANTDTDIFDGITNCGYWELSLNEIKISSSNSFDHQGCYNDLINDLPIEIRVYP